MKTKDYTLHLIIGMILFAALFGCKYTDENVKEMFKVIKIDSCEYIAGSYYKEGMAIVHKANCPNHLIREPFYDGEGNVIPDNIVRLLVQDQFCIMTKPEIDSIKKYFYFYEETWINKGVDADTGTILRLDQSGDITPPLKMRCTKYNEDGLWCKKDSELRPEIGKILKQERTDDEVMDGISNLIKLYRI